MLRRLDIAIGLVNRPEVLFLDEPTTGLDPEARAKVWNVLHTLATKDGLSILVTTHYLEEADEYAAQVAIIDRGRVVIQGVPAMLKADLGGDSIQVTLESLDASRQAAKVLASTYSAEAVALDQREVRTRVRDGAHELPIVLATLESHRIPVAAASVARPSLDDVYLRHCGRSFQSAEEVYAE
jgi:ABC-2 type transport system ATP-binding protein